MGNPFSACRHGPACLRPGCGKPTYNGKAGEYCSKTCRNSQNNAPNNSQGAVCSTPGCSKPTFNGKPGEYCSKTCRNNASQTKAVCLTPGCGKPTFNGNPGEYCSKACKNSAPPVCLTPGCCKPTYNGKPGEYCSKACRNSKNNAPNNVVPINSLTQNPNPRLVPLQTGDKDFDSVKKQYEDKWDKSRGPPTPVRAIYEVQPSATQSKAFHDECTKIGNVECFGFGKNPGNVQRRFHGTALKCPFNGTLCSQNACSTCRIIQNGFDLNLGGSWSGSPGVYGNGVYFTSMSSTAKGYGIDKSAGYTFQKNNWQDPKAGNSVLMALIACGRVETVKESDPPTPLDKSQYDARKVDKASGADELVIWEKEKAFVKWVVVF